MATDSVLTYPVFLETPQLRLRPFVPEDAEAVFRYRRDPDLMRYIPVGADKTIEDTRKLLDHYITHQETYGFSKWAVELRETGELIGDSGPLLLESGPDFELGYRIAREYWGRGLATECARAWVETAFSRLGLDRVVALANPDNAASIRIMIKLGMTFERPIRVHGIDCVLYSISRAKNLQPTIYFKEPGPEK